MQIKQYRIRFEIEREMSMKVVILSGTIVGSKTKAAMQQTASMFQRKYGEHEVVFLDLANYNLQFSDGRPFYEYEGDTRYVTETIMDADAVIIGAPVFQSSLPAPLKNIFDLLPFDAFQRKVVSIIVTAGTSKHFLMAEQHIKPILTFMKATVVPTIVFIEEKDFNGDEIASGEILYRIDQLLEDTVLTVEASKQMMQRKLESLSNNS